MNSGEILAFPSSSSYIRLLQFPYAKGQEWPYSIVVSLSCLSVPSCSWTSGLDSTSQLYDLPSLHWASRNKGQERTRGSAHGHQEKSSAWSALPPSPVRWIIIFMLLKDSSSSFHRSLLPLLTPNILSDHTDTCVRNDVSFGCAVEKRAKALEHRALSVVIN